MNRRGRPPGESGNREAILAAARVLFAERGYDRASIRAIARQAGVDAALVHHYFGTKEDLLRAAVQFPMPAAELLAEAFTDLEHVGEAIVRTFLGLWESPAVRDHMLALLRAALTHPGAAAMLRDLVTREAMAPITSRLALSRPQLRAELTGTQLIGLALARYGVGLEPLASADVDTLVAAVGPTVQRYLTDPDLLP